MRPVTPQQQQQLPLVEQSQACTQGWMTQLLLVSQAKELVEQKEVVGQQVIRSAGCHPRSQTLRSALPSKAPQLLQCHQHQPQKLALCHLHQPSKLVQHCLHPPLKPAPLPRHTKKTGRQVFLQRQEHAAKKTPGLMPETGLLSSLKASSSRSRGHVSKICPTPSAPSKPLMQVAAVSRADHSTSPAAASAAQTVAEKELRKRRPVRTCRWRSACRQCVRARARWQEVA